MASCPGEVDAARAWGEDRQAPLERSVTAGNDVGRRRHDLDRIRHGVQMQLTCGPAQRGIETQRRVRRECEDDGISYCVAGDGRMDAQRLDARPRSARTPATETEAEAEDEG